MDDVAHVWNAHIIRPSANPNVPSGQPNVMFSWPELYGTQDYICAVDNDALQLCKSRCTFRQPVPCDPDVYELCNILMTELNLPIPSEIYQALDLYMCLREKLIELL